MLIAVLMSVILKNVIVLSVIIRIIQRVIMLCVVGLSVIAPSNLVSLKKIQITKICYFCQAYKELLTEPPSH